MAKIIIHTETTQEGLERKMENQKPQPLNNLTKGEKTALQELGERDDIVIIWSDKSGA